MNMLMGVSIVVGVVWVGRWFWVNRGTCYDADARKLKKEIENCRRHLERYRAAVDEANRKMLNPAATPENIETLRHEVKMAGYGIQRTVRDIEKKTACLTELEAESARQKASWKKQEEQEDQISRL
jgi:chromosome segregation ATPase